MIRRRLNFTCEQAKQPFYLLIFFKPSMQSLNKSKGSSKDTNQPHLELFKDVFPLAYEVISFGDKTSEYSEEFEMKLSAFVDENVDSSDGGCEIVASSQREVSEGQKIELISSITAAASCNTVSSTGNVDDENSLMVMMDVPTFAPPTDTGIFGDKSITIVNNSGHIQTVGLKVNGKSAVLFERVGHQNQVMVRIEPKIYLTVITKKNNDMLIRQEISSDELIAIDLSRMLQNTIDISIGQDWNGKWKIKYH